MDFEISIQLEHVGNIENKRLSYNVSISPPIKKCLIKITTTGYLDIYNMKCRFISLNYKY